MARAHGRGSTATADHASARCRFRTAITAGPVPCGRGDDDLFTLEDSMALSAAELVKADQDHLIHPLHHPVDNMEPMIYVRGRGAMIQDIGGHRDIRGLAGVWN